MKEIIEKDWISAGVIAKKALLYGKELIVEGADSLVVCNKIEDFIKKNNGNLAFPPQVSFNDCAAHFCPTKLNHPVFSKNDMIKLDVGVEVNGAIGDTALTVDLSGQDELVEASIEACEHALKIATVGTKLCELGQVIEETINGFGFSPVKNLCGHGLGLYIIHEYPTIPNYNNADKHELQFNDTIAIEPFATTGEGFIGEKGIPTIFAVPKKPKVRSTYSKIVLNKINQMPFAAHWFSDMPPMGFSMALKEINPIKYPPLVEVSGGFVSQHEHTLIVKDKKSIITTRLDSD